MPPLDLAPPRQAVGSLDRALGLAADRDWFDRRPRALRETLLAGIIRNSGLVYELSFRMIKRSLLADVESAELIERAAFRDVLRIAAGRGPVADAKAWFACRDMRNLSAHAYDQARARTVTGTSPCSRPTPGPCSRNWKSTMDDIPSPPPIDMPPEDWAIVRAILRCHVPGLEVWAFGSRAQRTARHYSDLDLAIITEAVLPFATMGAIAEDFSGSDLPWRVDVLDWAATGPAFRDIVARRKVALRRAERSGLP